MRGCGIVLSAALVLCAGCQTHRAVSNGPYNEVYNGGLSSGGTRVPESAAGLKPTEADVTFKTDYAPPQPNTAYSSPTNRVRVEVPAPEPEHYYVTLRSSQSAQVMRSAAPMRAESDQAQVASGADSSQPQLVASPSASGTLSVAEQEMSSRTTTGAAVATVSRGHRASSDARSVNAQEDASSVSTTAMARNAQELGDSSALAQPANAHQPMAALKVNALGAYERSNSVRAGVAPSTVAGSSDASATAGRSEALATSDVAVAGHAMAAAASVATQAHSVSNALAAREDAAAPKGYTGEDAANLLAGRDVVSEFGSAEFLLQTTTTGGPVVYKRFRAVRQFSDTQVPAGGAEAASVTTVHTPANAQGLSDSDAANETQVTKSVMAGRRADALEGDVAVRGLRLEAWTSAPVQLVKVQPPDLYVLKEGRLVDSGGIEKLLATGVIKDRPSGKWLVAYRITLLNASGSTARDIRIMDKIDASTALMVDSISTNAEAASAKCSPESGALEVTLPNLAAGGCFIVEFFAQPQESISKPAP